ncbi:hypothetical protein [Photobacterium leiognathi]|uniref:hypothetical protein n=1 Tax=Photobacterium leiognathi TaxID=553611 RepID=UPI00298252FB|nr:hypothetical protein [Photobacterium leiognathi]
MKKNELRFRVYRRFETALNKKGYLSLRSIIESNFSFPRKFTIDPVKKTKIKYVTIIKKERVLLEQQIAITKYTRKKVKDNNVKMNKLKKMFG